MQSPSGRLNPWIWVFLGLGFFWCFYVMSPWLLFINSDSAVPYQQATSVWRTQDLYYWGTTRMGMLYEVFWKLTRIRSAEWFFFGHVIFVFIGFPFWLATLSKKTTKATFLLFFIPITSNGISFYLTPAQPYGVVFALHGFFYYTLLKTKESHLKAFLLAVLIGTLWIQHELGGLIALGVCCSYYFPTLFQLKNRRAWTFWGTFLFSLLICYAFKRESRKWIATENHYELNTLPAIFNLLWLTVRDGHWWVSIRRLGGHALTVGMFFYGVEILKRKKNRAFFEDYGQTAFLMAVASIVAVHLSTWFVNNNSDPRYFSVALPTLIWSFMLKYESQLEGKRFRKAFLLLVCWIPLLQCQDPSLWANPWVRPYLRVSVDPTSGVFKDSVRECPHDDLERATAEISRFPLLEKFSITRHSEACLELTRQKTLALARAVQTSGCAGYIDDYWNSHILAAATSGEILTSSGTHIRNPELFQEVLKARPLCIMPRSNLAPELYTSGLHCEKTPYGFLICRD